MLAASLWTKTIVFALHAYLPCGGMFLAQYHRVHTAGRSISAEITSQDAQKRLGDEGLSPTALLVVLGPGVPSIPNMKQSLFITLFI